MVISGHIENGVVVLEGGVTLPEGTQVVVSLPAPSVSPQLPLPAPGSVPLPPREIRPRKRVVFPIIPSKNPGTMDITAEQIAEILDEEDAMGCGLPGWPAEPATPHPSASTPPPSPDGRRV